MPTPPASFTARLLSTRALLPRSQSTILPVTFAGSSTGAPLFTMEVEKHSATSVASAPGRPAVVESMNGAGPTAAASDAPVYVAPLPSVRVASPLRLCVPAATVVIHGDGCATVPVVGPLLPA